MRSVLFSRTFLLVLILFSTHSSLFSSNWYVHLSGSNSLVGSNGQSTGEPLQTIGYAFNNAAGPGDTVFVMQGVYTNTGYGSGALDNGVVAYLNNSGTEDSLIVLRSYPGDTVVIRFDGAGGFAANTLSYVEVSGFEIEGPNQSILLDSALAHRLDNPKPNYYNGRGIAIWGEAKHILIRNNRVHDCPASGIRVNKGDYITITHNEVYNNTWYTSSAESAIVLAESKSVDVKDTIKMVMSHNLVYNNYNQVPFYTENPPDVGIADYGTEDQDYIIDGSGVYITRNQTYDDGWFYLANNICYDNGINGVVVHKTDRAIVVNNTAFMNGKVPLSMGRQNSSGITVNEADQVKIFNNISWPRYETDYGYQIYGTVTNTDFDSNALVQGLSAFNEGVSMINPQFTDTADKDFSLSAGSPAIDAGVSNSFVPDTDFLGNERDAWPDMGALEFFQTTKIDIVEQEDDNIFKVYPNPFDKHLFLELRACVDNDVVVEIYRMDGKITLHFSGSFTKKTISTIDWRSGCYLVSVKNKGNYSTRLVVKK